MNYLTVNSLTVIINKMKGRRRFGKRKRSVKRRRFRKRLNRMKRTSYDGIYYAKCHSRVPMVADTVATAASMSVHWGSNGTSGTHD